MATALPSSFSFEMLSRIPASSFVQTWKEIRPDQDRNIYDMSEDNRIRFVIRGAPNEFLLNTGIHLAGSARLNIVASKVVAGAAVKPTQDDLIRYGAGADASLGNPIDFFQSSRESFNSGALPYLDNQDPVRSHQINQLRYRLTRRNAKREGAQITDLTEAYSSNQSKLEMGTGVNSRLAFEEPAEGVRLTLLSSIAAGVYSWETYDYGDKKFKIPLGTYSNFVNSPSVIPIGLCSSYSVNGWQIELATQRQAQAEAGDFAQGPVFFADTKLSSWTPDSMKCGAFINDLRIYVPIIRVLDPAVMQAVLGLYEKTELVTLGAVQFPLSLRVNSMAYRFANYPLPRGQNSYQFRMAGTDRSVRAYAWWIYNKNQASKGRNYLSDYSVRVSRLESSVGNEQLHDVVEDVTVNTSNVANFISINAQRSGAMFSPLPYYQEGRKEDGRQDDDLSRYNNVVSAIKMYDGVGLFYDKRALAYGVVSMENLDRRENEYSGSFQASGKDLTNVGAIDIRMRIEAYPVVTYTAASVVKTINGAVPPTNAEVNNLLVYPSSTIPDDNYEIIFAYAYDSVMEISPQGVMDITNAIL